MSDTSMFCFQCEQAADGKGCTRSGVCGKRPDVAAEQDRLTSDLIQLARASQGQPADPDRDELVMRGLFATVTNVNFDNASLGAIRREVQAATRKLGGAPAHDPAALFHGDADATSLRSTLLFGLRGMAAYAWHAQALGKTDPEVSAWHYKGLLAVGSDHTVEEWLGLILEFGMVNLKCMGLLDAANTGTYGHPVPTAVSTAREKGPFIVVSGHDLLDLQHLLEQTAGKGINVYTHGEMLPCHAYPGLKKHPHLKGNFGTAWQNQQKEFDQLPGPVLFTTNCLMSPRPSYADRVFTTAMVGWPGLMHISAGPDGRKDFGPVIRKALELGGWKETVPGGTLTTGFARNAVMGVADQVVGAIKAGAVKHIFLVGGCDGARPGRNYYTEFVEKTPQDTLVLTLACGKYRFNHLDIGKIGPFPRILDMGQCNDAYSAIQVAVALSKVFNCGVNDLPLTLVLSWYEQKAVCILLTLLALGIRNIRLGPSLPAFTSPAVLKVLVEKFNLMPVTTPDADLKAILGR
jgi:hydroxylamine reductase